MSYKTTIRVQSTRLLGPFENSLGERFASETLLIRDETTQRVYSFVINRTREGTSATQEFLLCLQRGEAFRATVSAKKCGPLETEVTRKILTVELPEVFRRLGEDER